MILYGDLLSLKQFFKIIKGVKRGPKSIIHISLLGNILLKPEMFILIMNVTVFSSVKQLGVLKGENFKQTFKKWFNNTTKHQFMFRCRISKSRSYRILTIRQKTSLLCAKKIVSSQVSMFFFSFVLISRFLVSNRTHYRFVLLNTDFRFQRNTSQSLQCLSKFISIIATDSMNLDA